MKKFISSIIVTVSVIACVSCDRHEWENSAEGTKDGTKNLYHAEDSHGKQDAHGEKESSHAEDHSSSKH
ncbi:MAG: hypothetical protein ACSHX0_01550 [Akkermansiaceae bacterium]